MFIFGHAGLTLGAAVALTAVVEQISPLMLKHNRKNESDEMLDTTAEKGTAPAERSLLKSLSSLMGDLRILFLGAFLPDIIDKPIAWLFFNYPAGNGRLYGHTLVFFLFLFIAGYYLYAFRHKKWLLVLAFGTFCHLVIDSMWAFPQTLLWPLMSWDFAAKIRADWAGTLFSEIVSKPKVLIAEIAGIAILAWFFLAVLRNKSLSSFIMKGRV